MTFCISQISRNYSDKALPFAGTKGAMQKQTPPNVKNFLRFRFVRGNFPLVSFTRHPFKDTSYSHSPTRTQQISQTPSFFSRFISSNIASLIIISLKRRELVAGGGFSVHPLLPARHHKADCSSLASKEARTQLIIRIIVFRSAFLRRAAVVTYSA